MLNIDHKFALVLFDGGGRAIGKRRSGSGLGAGRAVDELLLPSPGRTAAQRRLRDRVHPSAVGPRTGRALLSRFSCRPLRGTASRRAPRTFRRATFGALAAKAAALFIEQGKLEKDAIFRYVVIALGRKDADSAPHTKGLQVEERVEPLHAARLFLCRNGKSGRRRSAWSIPTTCRCSFRKTCSTRWPRRRLPSVAARPAAS